MSYGLKVSGVLRVVEQVLESDKKMSVVFLFIGGTEKRGNRVWAPTIGAVWGRGTGSVRVSRIRAARASERLVSVGAVSL